MTPLSPANKLTKLGKPLDTSIYGYSESIGSLLYLSVCTRPDIAQAVGALSRYMSMPTTENWSAAKGVLKYLGNRGARHHLWRSGQLQATVAVSAAEAKYMAVAQAVKDVLPTPCTMAT